MKVLVSLLVAMSFFLHMRSIGINITPFGIFVTLSVGVYFIAEQLLRMRIIPMMAFAYLSIFFVIGLLNQNNLYYTVYDFARMLSAAGFFFYSFYYFKERGYIHFIDSLVYFSKITILVFLILFCIVWYLKFNDHKIYAQVNIDLIFLIMLSLYERKYMLYALLFSLLSLKRMTMIATIATFLLKVGSIKVVHLLRMLIFLPIILLVALEAGLLDKYVLTYEKIAREISNLDFDSVESFIDFAYTIDYVRAVEIDKVISSMGQESWLFGNGMGGGLIDRYYVTGEIAQVSFAHFLYPSLLSKMGLFGLLIPLLVFVFVLLKVEGSYNVFLVLIYGLLSSFFAAYIVSSWAFWMCLGGGLGVCFHGNTKVEH